MSKAKRLIGLFYSGIVLLWTRHHFIISPVVWKHYLNRLGYKLKFLTNYPYLDPSNQKDYLQWINTKSEKETLHQKFDYKPFISFIIPVYNTQPDILTACINSALEQSYGNIEVCIVDDHSSNPETIATLTTYKLNSRVKLKTRQTNGHISIASNDAIEIAEGEFIAILDHDDTVDPDAIYEVVKALNQNGELDFVYSDEDKLDETGKRCFPHFKPDFSPDTLLSSNYICHLSVIRRKLVLEAGGFRKAYDGAQDHDLFLRITKLTDKFYHIPKILYHWRMTEESTSSSSKNKDYALGNGVKAIKDFLLSKNIKAEVASFQNTGYYIVDYITETEPLVSIIIPTKDNYLLLDDCLSSIFSLTRYTHFEVLVVNNRSTQKETFDTFEKYRKEYSNFRVLDLDVDFNFSTINNEAVKQTAGEYILLLNNDTKVIDPTWLHTMVGYASQQHIGAVGPILLYKDKSIQHAGVVLGIGGIAAHAYQHTIETNGELYGRLSAPYNYIAVTAACLMVSRKKFDEVYGFDDQLKVVYNDVDFCLKLYAAGYYNVLLPQVKLFHFESKSRGSDFTTQKYKRYLSETEYMHKKWGKIIDNDPLYNSNFTKSNWFLLDKAPSKDKS